MADLAISFTASRDLDDGGRAVILNVLTTGVPPAARYITGGARGGDAFIGRWLFEHRPEAEHHVIVPGNKSQVDPWWLTIDGVVRITLMPSFSTYQDRNAELVRQGDAVCGFPAYEENNSPPSGLWQTIRMAPAAGKLHRWDCVKPPYRGRIEMPLRKFGIQAEGVRSERA